MSMHRLHIAAAALLAGTFAIPGASCAQPVMKLANATVNDVQHGPIFFLPVPFALMAQSAPATVAKPPRIPLTFVAFVVMLPDEMAAFFGPIRRYFVESPDGAEALEFAASYKDWRKVPLAGA